MDQALRREPGAPIASKETPSTDQSTLYNVQGASPSAPTGTSLTAGLSGQVVQKSNWGQDLKGVDD